MFDILLSSPFLFVIGNYHVIRYTGADGVTGEANIVLRRRSEG